MLIFDWNSGRLLRRDYNDGVRKLDFDYSSDGKSVQIGDNLGRQIAVRRNDKGLIDRITDPRGFAFQYEYNAQDELATITDRSGGVRRLYYENAGFPHYLTRMVIERGGGETTEIKYDYDGDARLGGIDTGAGEIGMEYADGPSGSGIQTVVDKATGGRTEVHYDSAGRVTKQVDAAGVVQTYEYFPDDPADRQAFKTSPRAARSSTIIPATHRRCGRAT